MSLNLDRLQQAIKKYYHRNKGIMDTLSKLNVATAKTQRAVIKTATQCGCTEIFVTKQPPGFNGEAESMLVGSVCPSCRETLEKNMGDVLFYLISLMMLTGTDTETVVTEQIRQMEWLGKFNLK